MDENGASSYLTSDYEGLSAEFLEQQPAAGDLRRVAMELAAALAYIHQQQVVHRDLKPQNIMITHNGHYVKVIDFGLADTDSHAILKQPAGTLRSIQLPTTIRSIGDWAFRWCSSLDTIALPDRLERIGHDAFNRCALRSVFITASVVSLTSTSVSYCQQLTRVVVSADNPVYDSRDGCNAIIETRTNTLLSASCTARIPRSAPSRASLDVVARFIGYADYDAFCTSTGNGSDAVASNTVLSRHINVSADLKENDCLLLSWAPGRMAANYVCGKCGGIRFERI